MKYSLEVVIEVEATTHDEALMMLERALAGQAEHRVLNVWETK